MIVDILLLGLGSWLLCTRLNLLESFLALGDSVDAVHLILVES